MRRFSFEALFCCYCQLWFWIQTVTTEILIAITNNNVRHKTSSFSALTGMMTSIYHVSLSCLCFCFCTEEESHQARYSGNSVLSILCFDFLSHLTALHFQWMQRRLVTNFSSETFSLIDITDLFYSEALETRQVPKSCSVSTTASVASRLKTHLPPKIWHRTRMKVAFFF